MHSTFSRSAISVPARQAARSSRKLVLVQASSEDASRRVALGAFLAGTVLPLAAEAKIKNPAQDSLKRGGSSTQASMSAFDMEGTKKRGIKPDKRKEFLDQAKAKAQKLAGGR